MVRSCSGKVILSSWLLLFSLYSHQVLDNPSSSTTLNTKMMKVVLKVDIHDEKSKQKAMKAVSSLPGINSITMELKERKMTVVGEVDPVEVVEKLRKLWFAEILTVGPPKDETKETKDEKKETKDDKKPPICFPYYYYNHYPIYYSMQEENPNGCVLC